MFLANKSKSSKRTSRRFSVSWSHSVARNELEGRALPAVFFYAEPFGTVLNDAISHVGQDSDHHTINGGGYVESEIQRTFSFEDGTAYTLTERNQVTTTLSSPGPDPSSATGGVFVVTTHTGFDQVESNYPNIGFLQGEVGQGSGARATDAFNWRVRELDGSQLSGSINVGFRISITAPASRFGTMSQLNITSTYINIRMNIFEGLIVTDASTGEILHEEPYFSNTGGSYEFAMSYPLPQGLTELPVFMTLDGRHTSGPGGPFSIDGVQETANQSSEFTYSFAMTHHSGGRGLVHNTNERNYAPSQNNPYFILPPNTQTGLLPADDQTGAILAGSETGYRKKPSRNQPLTLVNNTIR